MSLLFGISIATIEKDNLISGYSLIKNNKSLYCNAEVVEIKKVSRGSRFEVKLKSCNISEFNNYFSIVNTNDEVELDPGSLINIRGIVTIPKNFNNFNYRGYLIKERIIFVFRDPEIEIIEQRKNFSSKIKEEMNNVYAKYLSIEDRYLLNGMIIGNKYIFSDKYEEKVKRSGISHLMVVSGLHVMLLTNCIIGIVGNFFGRRVSFVITLLLICFYVALVGVSAAIVRAVIMGIIPFMAALFGRKSEAVNLLFLAGLLLILINPWVIIFDIGFQLSFLATLGIIKFKVIFDLLFKFIPSMVFVRDSFSITFSAQLLTVPLILHSFNGISVVLPLTNLALTVFVPVIIIGGFVIFFVGSFDFFGYILSICYKPILGYCNYIISICSDYRMSYLEINTVPIWFWFIYLIIFLFLVIFRRVIVKK